MAKIDGEALLKRLPSVRGRLMPNAALADLTWFKTGGPAEVLFMPADEADLAQFLKNTPRDINVYVIGVGSNLLVRDGGMPGVVIRLGKGFNEITLAGPHQIRAGTAALDMRVAQFALSHSIDSLTFLIGIPGTIGGALRMNGGAHGGETTDVLLEARAVDREGNIKVLQHADMNYTYRHCGAPEDLIFTEALFQGTPGDAAAIKAKMDAHVEHRVNAQPIKSRTGGSTFKNPPGNKSWQLIDKAGMRGFAVGPAKVSEMHCNFLINEGGATAAQIEELGETVRAKVKQNSGVDLEWEIKRIGQTGERLMAYNPALTTVAVVMGGWSAERNVSLSSGDACATALREAGFNVIPIDVKRETIASVLMDMRPDVIFNALHGKWGEDGTASALFETLNIPYTHSGVLASALAMHKEKSKCIFRAAGIGVAESQLVDIEQAATRHPMALPYVIKPVDQGSSVGVHIIDRTANGPLASLLEERHFFGDKVMVERFIPGRELTCAVMGDVALGVIEILQDSQFYDYEAKYALGGSRHILPADIPVETYRRCQRFALMAHQALGCRGISRSDFRFDDTTDKHELILLETNTQPGMTGTSLVPELAAHAGHSFPDLVTWMVNDASVGR